MEPCGYGGIGRRSGLRIRCLRRGGSSPFSRTRPSAGGIRSETVVVPRIVRKKRTETESFAEGIGIASSLLLFFKNR